MAQPLLIAGTLLLFGGLAGVWASFRARRNGDPWRGNALFSAALTLYGALTLTGPRFNGTVMSEVIVWVVAAAVWMGLWIARRERRMTARRSG